MSKNDDHASESEQGLFTPTETLFVEECCKDHNNRNLVQCLDKILEKLEEEKGAIDERIHNKQEHHDTILFKRLQDQVEKIERIKQDLIIAKALDATSRCWDRSPEISNARPPLMRSVDDEDTIQTKRKQHWDISGAVKTGVWNPYQSASPYNHGGGWSKVSLHAHTDEAADDKREYLPGEPAEVVIKDGKTAKFQLIGLVANQAMSLISEATQQLAGTEGIKLIQGTEYLFESGVGPHLGFYKDYPELTMPFHPTMGIPFETPGARFSCPPSTLFAEELQTVHFMEMANGYVRQMDPEPYNEFSWRSDKLWDTLLSDNCLLWGAGSGDAYQQVTDGKTNPKTELGLVYNVVCQPKDSTTEELMAAYRTGCSYISTGVELTAIEVSDEGVIRVCANKENPSNPTDGSSNTSFRIVATTNNGAFLDISYTNEIKFDPWKKLKEAMEDFEEGKSDMDREYTKKNYENATYVRITVNAVTHHKGCVPGERRVHQEYAWTQPFWLMLDGFCLARDRRVLSHQSKGVEGKGTYPNCSLKEMYAGRLQYTFALKDQQIDCI